MSLAADLRYAARGLRRNPGFTITAVLTLAFGIGANAAMFGVVDRLLLSAPPHVRDPERVAQIDMELLTQDGTPFTMSSTSYPTFSDLHDQVQAFAATAAVSSGEMVYGTGAQAQSLPGAKVTGEYFTVLGTRPALGRFFGVDEDRAPSGTPVAVIGNAFWRREFGRDRAIIGRAIVLDNVSYTIVGVAPSGFTGSRAEPVDVWVPLSAAMAAQGTEWRSTRFMRLVEILARRKDDAPPALAATQATMALRRGLTGAGRADSTARVVLNSLVPGKGTAGRSTQGQIALWLAGMSIVVFAIAVANVANLMLLRALRRRREIAVRLALGAGRWRLTRQLAIESLLLAAMGGAMALLVARWGSEAVRIVLMPNLAASETIVPPRVLIVTALGTLIAAMVTGLLPALRASRPSVVADLKSATGAGSDAHRAPILATLVVVQNALSVLLLVGAGLFVTSLYRVRTQDFGFSTDRVLLAEMKFPRGSLVGTTQDALYRRAEEEVRRLPGVELTTVVQAMPFAGHNVPPIAVPGNDAFPDQSQQVPFLNAATPTFFRAMGMRLLDGRNFAEGDRAGSQLVVIVNEAMARGLWPNERALGKCIRIGFPPGNAPPMSIHAEPTVACREIVGVVNNARPRSIREEAGQARMMYYVPIEQVPVPGFVASPSNIWGIVIKTSGAENVAPAIRRAMQSFASDLPLTEVRPLQDLLDRQIRPWKLGASVFSAFGLLALALAALGLYGVRAYSVTQRTREMGVRIALGARRRDVVRLVLVEGLRVMGIGVTLGALSAFGAGRFIEPLLFRTSPRDPAIFAMVGATLALMAVAASAIPAWRAASVEPDVALRAE